MGAVRKIEERVVEGKRLGRHVNHDDRSLAYRVSVPEGTTPTTVRWDRQIPVLNQGDVGSCTGNATVGSLGTSPTYATLAALMAADPPLVLDENEALTIYSDAEKLDGGQGYPPEDNGSSGLSVAQVAKNLGLISGYLHVTNIDEAHAAIQAGPVIIGSDWYDSFDTPDANGLVEIAAGATVRGGHEYECIGYDASTDLWECVNSWGDGWGVGGHFFMSSATLTQLLSTDGDMTSFVPISQPAPTPAPPTPTPGPGPSPDPNPQPEPDPEPQGRHHWDPFAPIEEVVEDAVEFVEDHVGHHGATVETEGETTEEDDAEHPESEEDTGSGDEEVAGGEETPGDGDGDQTAATHEGEGGSQPS